MAKLDGLPFNWARYGALVRSERNRLGYKTADEFATTVWMRSRVEISSVSIYKIEQGNQVPDAMQFMGINLALFGSPFPEELICPGLGSDWREIIKAYETRPEVTPAAPYVPASWQLENCHTGEYLESEGYLVREPESLFWPIPPADPGALDIDTQA